jgi:hypothetical protein
MHPGHPARTQMLMMQQQLQLVQQQLWLSHQG